MLKIEDIKTPNTIEGFRNNLKKYCLGSKENIFIYKKSNGKQYSLNINKISKISDVLKSLKSDNLYSIFAGDFNLILMCDISHINLENVIKKDKNAIFKLREVYLFNNQDREERHNFLSSTERVIEKIISGCEEWKEIDANPEQTAINSNRLSVLYIHLFGEYFDTVRGSKKEYNLSKYN